MPLTEIAQLAQSASVILASLFAIYGFDAWRREHIGKRRIELAEEVLALFYQARDSISEIRSPFGHCGEGSTRKPSPHEPPEHKEKLDRAYVLIERYKQHSELFSRIRAIRYRFMALLGKDAAHPFDSLNRIVNELIMSSQRMARLSTVPEWSTRSPAIEERNHKEFLEIFAVYYASYGDDDPISPRVDEAVSEIEQICRGIIESQGTLFSAFNIRLKFGKRAAPKGP